MDKTMDGKEVEFKESCLKPLSDDDLESAAGGIATPGQILAFRWYCNYPGCEAKGAWFTDINDVQQDPRWDEHIRLNPGHTRSLGTMMTGMVTP